jgi:hypothetical protein
MKKIILFSMGQLLLISMNGQTTDEKVKGLRTPPTEYKIVQNQNGSIDTMMVFLNPLPKDSTPSTIYTWKGKRVPFEIYRDSLKLEYFNFCDSLKKKKRN